MLTKVLLLTSRNKLKQAIMITIHLPKSIHKRLAAVFGTSVVTTHWQAVTFDLTQVSLYWSFTVYSAYPVRKIK